MNKCDKKGRQVSATEIEITPEMIEAGVGEFYKYDDRFEPVDMAVIKIFRAMAAADSRRSVMLACDVVQSLSPYLTTSRDI